MSSELRSELLLWDITERRMRDKVTIGTQRLHTLSDLQAMSLKKLADVKRTAEDRTEQQWANSSRLLKNKILTKNRPGSLVVSIMAKTLKTAGKAVLTMAVAPVVTMGTSLVQSYRVTIDSDVNFLIPIFSRLSRAIKSPSAYEFLILRTTHWRIRKSKYILCQ